MKFKKKYKQKHPSSQKRKKKYSNEALGKVKKWNQFLN